MSTEEKLFLGATKLAVSVGWSIGWLVCRVTHSFDDPHYVALYWPKRLHFYCSYRSTYLIVFFLICFTDNFRCFKQTRNKAFNHFGIRFHFCFLKCEITLLLLPCFLLFPVFQLLSFGLAF